MYAIYAYIGVVLGGQCRHIWHTWSVWDTWIAWGCVTQVCSDAGRGARPEHVGQPGSVASASTGQLESERENSGIGADSKSPQCRHVDGTGFHCMRPMSERKRSQL